MNLIYSSGLDKIVEGNASFDRGILRVCYTGKNRNKSSISKEVFERCIGSIYNVPIVCRYDRDADEIGSHDMDVVRDANGDLKLVNLTQPVGVVPESAQWYWETLEEEDGAIHEYLCVEVLLWKRQEAYEKIKRDGITDESMEITVLDGRLTDGIYVIERFEFTAFCLLGTAEPCYESASLLMFAEDSFREQYHAMMKELKETYQPAAPSGTGGDTEYFSEGGNETLDQEKMELLAAYGLSVEQLEFDANDMSLDELKAKLVELKTFDDDPAEEPAEDPAEEPAEEPVEPEVPEDDGDDDTAVKKTASGDSSFALAGQLLESICDALCAEKMETVWGEESRYWYVDHDDEMGEVYAYDGMDWNLYGFAYAKKGDTVSIDFATKKRMKFTIVEFDEGEQSSAAGSVFARASEQFCAREKQWAEQFAANEAELNSLRAFKADTETAAANAEFERGCEGVFEQFTDLEGSEAFAALREDHAGYTLEALEEKCFALRGRMQTGKFAMQAPVAPKAPRLPIEKSLLDAPEKPSEDPYGGVFQEYGVAN